MNFESLDEIARYGFQGFHSVTTLQASNCRAVPAEPGVYLVLRTATTPPVFLDRSVAGLYKGKDPTVPFGKLAAKWVPGTGVIYIGKAGTSGGRATLKTRLHEYMRSGVGLPHRHWGGRYVCQLADSGSLVVCWKPTPSEDPAKVESRLIQEFVVRFGKRPFANLRN
jgi:hypothetical protein